MERMKNAMIPCQKKIKNSEILRTLKILDRTCIRYFNIVYALKGASCRVLLQLKNKLNLPGP